MEISHIKQISICATNHSWWHHKPSALALICAWLSSLWSITILILIPRRKTVALEEYKCAKTAVCGGLMDSVNLNVQCLDWHSLLFFIWVRLFPSSMPGTSARSPVQFQNSYNIASLSFLSVEYSNHPEQIVFFAILRGVTSLFCQLEPPANHLHDDIQVNICPEQYLNMIGSSSDIEAKTCRHFFEKGQQVGVLVGFLLNSWSWSWSALFHRWMIACGSASHNFTYHLQNIWWNRS